jgi:4-diphosphocytidyl-2-C-methyl-D-erythritol kinase
MDYVRTKSYAKLNLTLHVTGTNGGYHMLDSLVCSVDLYDLISVKKRKDSNVTITMRGFGSEGIPFESNNAVKAAERFIEYYGTTGCDITVDKNIPMGLGLGGSSADAAGVLNALAKLYKVGEKIGIKKIADTTGSDTKYMLDGGYARLFGRGDEVKPVEADTRLNFLLLAPKGGVSTAECFRRFDSDGKFGGNSDDAEYALTNGDKAALGKCLGNSLFPAARTLSDDIKRAYDDLSSFDPLAVNMTGSGSGVYALFESPEYCTYAKSRYRGNMTAYVLKSV